MELTKYIKHILTALFLFALTACTEKEAPFANGENSRSVVFRPQLDNGINTRAIGDASKINQLIVVVFEMGDNDNASEIFRNEFSWTEAQQTGVSLNLIEGKRYGILFWAQCSGNQSEAISAYNIGENGIVSVDYTGYLNGGFAKIEELDAFYSFEKIEVIGDMLDFIQLTRPLAQLNFADNYAEELQPTEGTHKTSLTFHSIATSFNPVTGEIESTDPDNESDDITFVFTDFPTEKLIIGGTENYYVACNYLLAPAEGTAQISATLDFQNIDGTSIKELKFKEVGNTITIERNKRTNVIGSIVKQPETWSIWDGTIPTDSPIATDDQNRYVIDEAADIAWLGIHAAELESQSTFILTKDIDMAGISGLSSINLPENSTLVGLKSNGEVPTIKGIRMSGALFGNANKINVRDIIIDDAIISNASTKAVDTEHAGILVNILKGSSSFINITISNSSVETTKGAAGGMIGYISRVAEKDRTETLDVSFKDCILNNVTISGSASEGKFIGLLSGYDNNENVSFDSSCKANDVIVTDYKSIYTKANNSEWAGETDTRYDGWIGNATYHRAKIIFGDKRMAPKWDGTTATAKADLLLYNGESNKYEVHSPFDLAGVRKATASPAALYLMENVDMNGQGADKKYFVHSNFTKSAYNSADDNNFNAFSSIALLDGNEYGIYNLALNSNGSDRYAFILSGDNGHIHRNTNFYNCCTVVPHIVGTDNGQTVDKSYGATVVLSVGGATYTMDNVHAFGCKVFAIQKTGILAGRIVSTTKATISNCSVNKCYIENYKCQEHKELFEESIVSAEFYSYGEIGALVGFIKYNAIINGCSVNNTTINAYGQDDQKCNIANIIRAGTIPGRHVNQFIGDIRSQEGYTVSISDCSVSNNSYSQDSHTHKKGTSIPIIGEAYCLGAKIFILGQKGDKKGTVKVKNITVDGSKNFTSETSVTLQELM